jgi:hypothetical protein
LFVPLTKALLEAISRIMQAASSHIIPLRTNTAYFAKRHLTPLIFL